MTEGDRSNAGEGPRVTLARGNPRGMSEGDRQRARPRGFTLVELMVALLVSSLLVGMILAIFSRMSIAYRGQQQIAGVQQVLAAARAAIEFDAKQAGLGVADGFQTPFTGTSLISPVTVVDSSAGPDQVAFFYADTSTQAVIFDDASAFPTLNVDIVDGFAPGDLIVLSKANTSTLGLQSGEAHLTTYTACAFQIDPGPNSVTAGVPPTVPGTLRVATTGSWGALASYCSALMKKGVMVYKFVAHGYRINATTPALAAVGVLEQSTNGGLLGPADTWSVLAHGFSDLQTALRVYQANAAVDADGDGDVKRDWFSGNNQDALTAAPLPVPAPGLLQISISLVAHTDRAVEGIATSQTPSLTAANADNNPLGDHPSVALPSANPLFPGQRIYRYITFQVDFRNLGVGR